MDKPLELVLKELEEKIVKEINEVSLQPFLVRPIIEKIYNQVVVLEQQAYVQKKQDYEKTLEKGGNDNE